MKKIGVIGVSNGVNPASRYFNTGNMLHAQAGRNLLEDFIELPSTSLWSRELIARINAELSHLVYIAANGIRVGAKENEVSRHHDVVADNLEKVHIPVVTFGLGAQVPVAKAHSWDIPPSTVRLVKVLSDKNHAIAVRGDVTAEVIHQYIGVNNVEVLGCPSNFWHRQPQFSVSLKCTSSLLPAEVGFSYTAPVREAKLLRMSIKKGFHLIGQEHYYERKILSGDINQSKNVPFSKVFKTDEGWHEFCDAVRQRFHIFYSLDEWMGFLSNVRFMFGSRFHGNMTALQSGIKSLWIVHDSRTRELCSYHKLPALSLADAIRINNVDEFAAKCDYSEYIAKYPECYRRFYNYLLRSGVPTKLAPPINEAIHSRTNYSEERSRYRIATAESLGNRKELCLRNIDKGIEGTIQAETNTSYNRYPRVFSVASKLTSEASSRNILSLGCSTGEEVETLASEYFNRSADTLVGLDVRDDVVELAKRYNSCPERVDFLTTNQVPASFEGSFDMVFAMSVLCIWPTSKQLADISGLFPFERFEKVLAVVDRYIKVGGYLVLFNSNYMFEDSSVSGRYMPVSVSGLDSRGGVKLFGKDSKEILINPRAPFVFFRKLF